MRTTRQFQRYISFLAQSVKQHRLHRSIAFHPPSWSTSRHQCQQQVSRRTFASTSTMSARRPFKETEAERVPFRRDDSFELTQAPDIHFKPGGGLNNLPLAPKFEPSAAEWRNIKPEELAAAQRYKLLVTAITPRPIAFVSSMSPEGKYNLAPFSYFNMVSHNPPTIMVSIQNNPDGRGGCKDTAFNIRETKEFSVSIISEPFVEAANYTAIDSPPGTDEWSLAGLTKRESETIKPPHVAEAAFSMECELSHVHDIESDDKSVVYTMVLGRVKRIHAKEFIFDPEDKFKVLPEALVPVSRLGGLSFGRTVQGYDLARPRWADVKDTEDVQKALGTE